jgi:hypothetical protein
MKKELVNQIIKNLEDGLGVLKEELRRSEETYKVGDRIKINCNPKEIYLISRTEHNVISLINVNTGLTWTSNVEVLDHNNLTKEDVERITAWNSYTKL